MLKTILVVSFLVCASFAIELSTDAFPPLWATWKTQYQKSYPPFEEPLRFAVFIENVNKINAFNAANDSPKLAINKFADLSASEFKSMYSYCAYKETNQTLIAENTLEQQIPEALPASVDWRSKGAVTPVKDQGQCGSCWAFSTTGVLEGFNFIHSGNLYSFSEQQIVDCDTKSGDEGCNGGFPYLALQYVAQNGIELEATYPYTGQDGTCQYERLKAHNVTNGYKFVQANSTDALKTALVDQPVSVGIEADQDVFQFYKSGVIKLNCGNNLDHAVLVVGYHKVGVLEAFIVKNSWGTDWGEDGYVQIWSNNKANGGEGVCGILAQPVIPTQ